MKKTISKFNKYSFIRTLIILLLISLPFMASDCANGILNGGNTGDVKGQWRLDDIQGYRQDVCLGEIANFPSTTGGTATLTCPNNGPSQTRLYTVSNNTLTYTETGVAYDINSNGVTLTLTGTNNLGRTLIYTKIAADHKVEATGNRDGHKNSSDN